MKKLLVGCLVVLVLLGAGAIVTTCYFARKVNQSIIQPMKSAAGELAQLGEIPKLEAEIRNTAPFSPPESGEFTEAQLRKLTDVQAKIRTTLGDRVKAMESKYKELFEKKGDAGIQDAPDLIRAYRDLAAAWLDGKKAQVAALNDAGLSLAEYHWIRGQAYAALGLPVMEVDVSKLANQIAQQAANPNDLPTSVSGSIGPSGPETNRKLVEPVKKALEDNVGLAMFGL